MTTPTPRRNLARLAGGVGSLAVIAACGSVSKASAPAATTPPVAAPAATAAPSPAPSPTSTLTGPVGTVYQVTDDSGNKMTVTLTRMIDPALGADQFSTPNNGFRFVGAVFTLRGVSGTFSGDANSDATVVGSNVQSYTPDFNSIAGVTNFNNGEFNLTPGTTSIGAVTFQVPDGVKAASVQWSGSIFGGAPATWVVPATSSSGTSSGAWATVSAYYQDITSKNYAAAWRLLGYNPQGGGYASFVAGYANTGTQTVTETSASGDQVSFTLTSNNPDGTVQTYTGTDTVTGGRIMAASVTQTS